jgi:transposase InsO family protein
MRSDAGGEFVSTAMAGFLAEKGISHVIVPPGAHAQSGRVERAHLTLLDSVGTFLVGSGLPSYLWAEAVSHAAYVRNRVPAKPNNTIPDDLVRQT